MNQLYTKRSENLKNGRKCNYPRPQLKRESFLSLDGIWELYADGEKYDILVPFCVESALSGVNKSFASGLFCYKKHFVLPNGFNKGRVLIHFGAVDQKCTLLINGREVGEHTGGYNAFSFDITDYIEKENEITLFVTDTLDLTLPYGKQKKKRGGMWYTPVSGIWQSVWLESVPKEYIKDIKIDVTLNSALITLYGVDFGEVVFNGKAYPIIDGKVNITVSNPVNWTPETPQLYEFTVKAGEDEVQSYFALRTLEIKGNELLLNGKPYFFNGLLDQGYFPDGIYTPADEEEYKDDILKMKSLGFNMLRKHIKVEPEAFYYYCDKYGMAVFQDMVNNGKYSFIRDTALPTVGIQRLNDKFTHRNKKARQSFISGMESTVKQLYNHPCIVEWTIFNEGWGQFCADSMYLKMKELDSSRFIDSASGWFKAKNNDFDSAHIYFKKLKAKKGDKPVFISEFGGYSYKIEEHSFNNENTYGYGKFARREDFVKALQSLYSDLFALKEKGLCAAVYTQVSDVEDETNGLLTYDRKVMKILPEEIKHVMEKLY
ncbi:MAG: glycoside hydrolase family 2 [Clostridia bacterium]|nr:glycoside hydrolase family 2 [Clostridia bacterium]